MHRLVLLAHDPIDNPEDYQGNHDDGDKSNNRFSNLEWTTPLENTHHAGLTGLTDRCIPVDVMILPEGDISRFPSCEAAARYLETKPDNVIYATRKPNDVVYSGGWRVKRFDTEWLPMPARALDTLTWKNGSTHNPVDIRNLETLEHKTFKLQSDAADYIGIGVSTLSQLLATNQRVLPTWLQVKNANDEWITVTNRWDKLVNDNPNIRPVILTEPNGCTKMFESVQKCADYLGVGKTTVSYNLKSKHGKKNKHGYIFEYYL